MLSIIILFIKWIWRFELPIPKTGRNK